jgi:hypothetical protein
MAWNFDGRHLLAVDLLANVPLLILMGIPCGQIVRQGLHQASRRSQF